MKVAIMNEFLRYGGTEVQTEREVTAFRKRGHEVILITFDPSEPKLETAEWCNYPLRSSMLNTIVGKIAPIPSITREIKRTLRAFNPDIVHINNVISAPISAYVVARKYPSVMTIRDYSAVCPKGTCIFDDGTGCDGYRYAKCYSRCARAHPKLLAKIPYYLYRSSLRKICFDAFLCPSDALSKACSTTFARTQCVNNPFDFSYEIDKCLDSKIKRYFYYGSIEENKGVSQLFEAWASFSKDKHDVELLLAGSIAKGYSDSFASLLDATPNARYLGSLSSSEIKKTYPYLYCVVVPSLWLENYPNTVLEALAYKTLVIGSSRGGIPELIDNQDRLFDINNINEFVNALEYSYNLRPEEYRKITCESFRKVLKNNSIEHYYLKLMSIYDSIL